MPRIPSISLIFSLSLIPAGKGPAPHDELPVVGAAGGWQTMACIAVFPKTLSEADTREIKKLMVSWEHLTFHR
jgi:hypothetical protein